MGISHLISTAFSIIDAFKFNVALDVATIFPTALYGCHLP